MKELKQIDFTCPNCKREYTIITFRKSPFCGKGVCCKCCKKKGLQSIDCKMIRLELERFAQGKRLNKNDLKGLLMEMAVSNALNDLGIPHEHNPFNNTYPNFQNTRPDIAIEKLNVVIECKNLSRKQVNHTLSQEWLNKNIVERPYFAKYKRKIAFFSFKPSQSAIQHLNVHGWRVYGLGEQILTDEQRKKAIGKVRQRLYWLKKVQ